MLETAVMCLSLLATFLLTFWFIVRQHYNYWKNRGFPSLKASFPFGNLPELSKGKKYLGDAYHEIYQHMKEKKYLGIFQLLRPILVVRDPEEVKNILTKNFDSFHSRDEELDPSVDWMYDTLFHMQDKGKWKYVRSGIVRAFSFVRMKQMFAEIVRISGGLRKRLDSLVDENPSVDVRTLMSGFTARVAFSCFFGLKTEGPEKEHELYKVSQATNDPRPTTVIRFLLYHVWTKLPLFFKVRTLPAYVTNFFNHLVKDIVDYRKESGDMRKDLFNEILESKDKMGTAFKSFLEDGKKTDNTSWDIDQDTLAAQAFLFYVASFDTTSFTMSACLRTLAEYPEVQKKVHEEIDRVLAANNGEITYDNIKEYTYLDQVLAEALRLMPPLPVLYRKSRKPYTTTEGLLVEPGVKIILPIYSIHRDPEFYPEPEKFIPERFSPENMKTRDPYTYLPFGLGPRMCLGMRFGLLQAKVGLVSLLKDYTLQVDERTRYPMVFSPKIFVVAVSEDGFYVKFARRKSTVQ